MTVEIDEDVRMSLEAIYTRLLDEARMSTDLGWVEISRVAKGKIEMLDTVFGMLGFAFVEVPGRVTVELVEVEHGGDEA